MLEDDPTWPKGNVVKRNIFWRGDGTNLRRTGWDQPPAHKTYQVAWWHHIQKSAFALVTMENNMVDADPRFVDEAAGDFRLRADSPAWNIGFQPIPFEKIGLYQDEYRASWPVSRKVDPLPEPIKRRNR